MKVNKMLQIVGIVLIAGIVQGMGAGEDWLTDFDAAKAQAKEQNIPILVDFTGSDWCGWCIRLDKEVFSRDEFKQFAEEHLILFVADFPNKKELPAAIKAQNEKLAAHYGIRGFPTILLLDAEGKELARTGYKPGGPEVYVKHLKALMAEK